MKRTLERNGGPRGKTDTYIERAIHLGDELKPGETVRILATIYAVRRDRVGLLTTAVATHRLHNDGALYYS